MKTEVYSWRLSTEIKSELERVARLRKTSVSSVLESAVRDWLGKSTVQVEEAEEQRRLHAAAEGCLGTFEGRDPQRAERANKSIRQRLSRRYGR